METAHPDEAMARLEAIASAVASVEQEEVAQENNAPDHIPDWSETLALVHRAADAFVAVGERTREIEGRLHDVSASASSAIERLEQDIRDLQHRLSQSEGRRAFAEEGLARLCAAIREHFSAATAVTDDNPTEAPLETLSAAAF